VSRSPTASPVVSAGLTVAVCGSILAGQIVRLLGGGGRFAAAGRPLTVLLRPGKTPSWTEIRGHLRRLVRRIRAHWPDTRLTIRGASHYGRPEVMAWCEANGLDYIFGLSGERARE